MEKRKVIRLKDYDYSSNGIYFVTICTVGRKSVLSEIVVGEGFHPLPQIKLTAIGEELNNTIKYVNDNYENVLIEKYVIMPNHLHMMISLGIENTGGHGNPPLQNIVGQIKSFTTRIYGEKLWQRSFYDHIVRNEKEYLEIWDYIDTNPSKWADDEYYS